MKCDTCDSNYACVLITDLLYGEVKIVMCMPCQHEYIYPLHVKMKTIHDVTNEYKEIYKKYINKKFAE